MNAPMTRRLSLFVFLTALVAAPLRAETPPELKELERYIGEWKSVIETTDITATSKTEWVVQGNIVQQKITYSDGAETLIMRGYDQQGSKYFLTLFDSRGVNWLTTGQWDAPSSTFRFEGRMGDTAVNIKSTFRNNNQTEDWTITLTSTDGKVSEIRGTNTKVVK